jgi:hypothetical protein
MIEPSETFPVCVQPAHCPVCWQPNGCRLETGESYKGPCWCEQPTLSAAAVRRLLSDLPEQRCLCRACLEGIAANPEITWSELVEQSRQAAAAQRPRDGDFYMEGGNVVFTAEYHLRRGACCESGCRHCPYLDPR